MSEREHIPRIPRGLSMKQGADWEREMILKYRAKGYSWEWISCELRCSVSTVTRRAKGLFKIRYKRPEMRRDLPPDWKPKPRRLTQGERAGEAAKVAYLKRREKRLIEEEERP